MQQVLWQKYETILRLQTMPVVLLFIFRPSILSVCSYFENV